MIIGSLNIRGGANALKRRRIGALIKKGNADVFLIQETKIVNMEGDLAKSFWHSSEADFSFSNSIGRSGGLLILWNNKVEVINSFRGEGYLGIKVCWENKFYYLINVYSPCIMIKKVELWKKLLELKEAFKDGDWIVGGDFNAIKNSRERKGRGLYVNNREMELFSEFIDKSELVDIPCKGKKFS